jgi:nucleoside-diphosphate-sugar epimerase
MKALVTGASGFLGSHLTRKLVARGDDVRCLVRKTKLGIPPEAEIVDGDILDPGSLGPAMKDRDVVFHCAALVGGYHTRDEFFETNEHGTRNVLEAAVNSGVKRLVHTSTMGVLGCRDHDGTDESAPLENSGDPYRDSKVAAERAVRESAHRSVTTVIRPGWVYGPGELNMLPQILERLLTGKMFVVAGGTKLVHPVFAGHVVDALLLAADRAEAAGQTYNVTDGLRITMKEFLETFARAAGAEGNIRSVPYPLALTAAAAGSLYEKVFGKNAPINLHKLRLLSTDFHFSVEKAKRELGYHPETSLEEGLRAFVEDYTTRKKEVSVS